MTILDDRPAVLTPLRTEDDSQRDWAAALALPRGPERTARMNWLIDERHSGVLLPVPSDPDVENISKGAAYFACSCPRCLSYGPDRRA